MPATHSCKPGPPAGPPGLRRRPRRPGRACALAGSGLLCLVTLLAVPTGAGAQVQDSGHTASASAGLVARGRDAALLPRLLGLASPRVPAAVRDAVLGDDSFDPSLAGRAWRVGRDPASCAQALFLGLLHRSALDDLRAGLQRQLADTTANRPALVVEHELALADAWIERGREAEAERFLRDRLARRVPEDASRNDPVDALAQQDRRWALTQKLALLNETTRPAEAEQLLLTLVADRSRALADHARAEAHGNPALMAPGSYLPLRLARDTALTRERLLTGLLLRRGEAARAADLARQASDAMLAFERRSARPDFTTPPPWRRLRQAWLDAQAAAAAGRSEDAIRLLQQCCAAPRGSPLQAEASTKDGAAVVRDGLQMLARLLLARGQHDAAAGVAMRLSLLVARDLEAQFDCLLTPARGTPEAARQQAAARAAEALADPWTTAIREQFGPGATVSHPVGRSRHLPEAVAPLQRATELGLLLLDLGLPHDARAVLLATQGLTAQVLGRQHPLALRALAGLWRAQQASGETAQAAALAITWREDSEAFLNQRVAQVSEPVRRRFFAEDRDTTAHWLALQLAAGRDDLPQQLLALSLGRKGLLAERAGRLARDALDSRDARVAPLRTRIDSLRQALAAQVLLDRGDSAEGRRIRRELDGAEADLAGLLPPAPVAAPTPAQWLGRLAADEALLDFLVFDDPAQPGRERMVAVLARGGSPPQLAVLAWDDLAPLRAQGLALRAAITGGEDSSAAAAALAARWWGPLEPQLTGVRRLWWVPDGLLQILPLHALAGSDGVPLAERHALVQLASPRDLPDPAAPAPTAGTAGTGAPAGAGAGSARPTALLIGAPRFDAGSARLAAAPEREAGRTGPTPQQALAPQLLAPDARGLRFTPLLGALLELNRVAGLLQRDHATTVRTGAQADKASLRSVRGPALLHLATHGFFLDDPARPDTAPGDPLVTLARAGLALAGAQADRPGGLITALEVASLDLRGTRLVVLSACETGLGQQTRQDGAYGLVRAFRVAGAQAVLGTLWPVSDAATQAFMEAFYARLAPGDAPPVALARAQRQLAADTRWGHPRHWAGFVLTGI